MGIFSVQNQIKRGDTPISEYFLKKQGFKKRKNWGAPSHWGRGAIFWEKIIAKYESGDPLPMGFVTIWYFPPTFTGYVSSFHGKSPNKILCLTTGDIPFNTEYSGDALCKNDIYFAIDRINYMLNNYNNL